MSNDGLKPIGGTQFITGEKPGGMNANMYTDAAGVVMGKVVMDISKQGPPKHAHGGSLIALLDEAMGASCWIQDYRVVAANLQFDLKQAVPLDVEITVIGRVDHKEGRKVFTTGEILLPDGTVAVEGKGLFIEAPQFMENAPFNPFTPSEDQ